MLDLKNVKLFEGDDPNVECTLTLEDSVLAALGDGSLKAKDAMAQDKMDVDGNVELVFALEPYVSSI